MELIQTLAMSVSYAGPGFNLKPSAGRIFRRLLWHCSHPFLPFLTGTKRKGSRVLFYTEATFLNPSEKKRKLQNLGLVSSGTFNLLI